MLTSNALSTSKPCQSSRSRQLALVLLHTIRTAVVVVQSVQHLTSSLASLLTVVTTVLSLPSLRKKTISNAFRIGLGLLGSLPFELQPFRYCFLFLLFRFLLLLTSPLPTLLLGLLLLSTL